MSFLFNVLFKDLPASVTTHLLREIGKGTMRSGLKCIASIGAGIGAGIALPASFCAGALFMRNKDKFHHSKNAAPVTNAEQCDTIINEGKTATDKHEASEQPNHGCEAAIEQSQEVNK